MSDWDRDSEREISQVTATIRDKYPQVADLLRNDVDREYLRVLLQCPKGHPLETVVLDEDINGYLMLRTVDEHASGDFTTHVATSAMPHGNAPDSMTMARLKFPCSRKNCRYDGTLRQAQLLRLFILARFVLNPSTNVNTPGIRVNT